MDKPTDPQLRLCGPAQNQAHPAEHGHHESSDAGTAPRAILAVSRVFPGWVSPTDQCLARSRVKTTLEALPQACSKILVAAVSSLPKSGLLLQPWGSQYAFSARPLASSGVPCASNLQGAVSALFPSSPSLEPHPLTGRALGR